MVQGALCHAVFPIYYFLANSANSFCLHLLTTHTSCGRICHMQKQDTKRVVLAVFRTAYPNDLSIVEASKRAGIAANTASTWIKVLTAERMLEESRKVGNAKMYRLRK